MHIGDKVKLIHSKEQGIITKIINDSTVEVEIEDGFKIPISKKEIVVVSVKEAKFFAEPSKKDDKSAIAEKGIFIAFAGEDYQLVSYLINNTDYELIYAYYDEKDSKTIAISSGKIESREFKLLKNATLENFDKWPVHVLQYFLFREGSNEIKPFIEKRLKFKAQGFRESKRQAPLIGKVAYTFQVDLEIGQLEKEQLKEKLTENQQKPASVTGVITKPAKELDLHIEKLTKDHLLMGNADKFKLQLDTFEKTLDQAIASGLSEITFIHGVGNGSLKIAIHKILSKNKSIKFFQDAQKDKFGYGATLVRIM